MIQRMEMNQRVKMEISSTFLLFLEKKIFVCLMLKESQ